MGGIAKQIGRRNLKCWTNFAWPRATTGIRHTHIEWPSTREGTRSVGTEARAELAARTAERADQRMGGGRISLVGTVESAAAGLDALDPQAFQIKPEDRETTALDQSTADGPSTGRQEEQQRRRIYGRTN